MAIDAKFLRELEDRPQVESIYHPQENLTHLLKNIEGVLYTDYPTFVIDWEGMRMREGWTYGMDGISYATTQSYIFQNIEKILEFVEQNKHQIVIYRCIMMSWYEEPNVCKDPRPILSYAKKPGAELIWPL